MRKTSVYLDELDAERLRKVAEEEGRSQAEVIRDAIYLYAARPKPVRDRNFAVFRLAEADVFPGPRRSIADTPEQELMKGFGSDAWSPAESRDPDS